MKRALLFTSLLAASSMATAYESTYDRLQWDQRGNDTNYCLDITDEQGNIAYGLQAIACGEGLHEFSPRNFVLQLLGADLPTGFSFYWKIWSPSGYGQAGFEGQVIVGSAGCQGGLPYASDAQNLQWGCRQQDITYCVDIFDANNNILNQAVACGDGLHSYSPAQLNLPAGDYIWRVWSPTGYGQTGFEGVFQVGAVNSALAVGGTLYADNCANCHGTDPSRGRDGIQRGADPAATRRAIDGNKGGMNYLSFLSDAELANIAAFIQNPNPVAQAVGVAPTTATTPTTEPQPVNGVVDNTVNNDNETNDNDGFDDRDDRDDDDGDDDRDDNDRDDDDDNGFDND